MKTIGFFSEMKLYEDGGTVSKYIVDKVDYNKSDIVEYLNNQKKIASCPRPAIDCITGKIISPSFSVYSDGEYEWCDFLIYHIQNYNIELEKEFVDKIARANL